MRRDDRFPMAGVLDGGAMQSGREGVRVCWAAHALGGRGGEPADPAPAPPIAPPLASLFPCRRCCSNHLSRCAPQPAVRRAAVGAEYNIPSNPSRVVPARRTMSLTGRPDANKCENSQQQLGIKQLARRPPP